MFIFITEQRGRNYLEFFFPMFFGKKNLPEILITSKSQILNGNDSWKSGISKSSIFLFQESKDYPSSLGFPQGCVACSLQ